MAGVEPVEGMVRLVVDVPAEMKEELKEDAAAQDLNLGQHVRRILAEAVYPREIAG